MIKKHIFSIWLNDEKPLPEIYRRCIETQEIPGYTHHLITTESLETASQYVREAIRAKKWVKASDYIRVEYIVNNGGIHLDADMEILPGKNFDDLLDNDMFTSRECTGLFANAAFGAIQQHPFLVEYLRVVESNFHGDGDMVFEPGIKAFNDLVHTFRKDKRDPQMSVYPTSYFFPYNHTTGVMDIRPETRVIHHYTKSWIPNESKI